MLGNGSPCLRGAVLPIEEHEYLLTRYALERLLYRLGASPHAGQFVLKGAVLFDVWTDQPSRATRDLDLLGQGDPALPRLEGIFRDLCGLPVDDDGLVFDPTFIRAAPIRDDEEYRGVRVHLTARLGQAQLPLQVDVGFGDVVTPAPIEMTVPSLLDLPDRHSPARWRRPCAAPDRRAGRAAAGPDVGVRRRREQTGAVARDHPARAAARRPARPAEVVAVLVNFLMSPAAGAGRGRAVRPAMAGWRVVATGPRRTTGLTIAIRGASGGGTGARDGRASVRDHR